MKKSNIKLINNDPEKLLKLIKEPNFEHIHEISDKQVLVLSKSIKTKFNKPIYLEACILETSKLDMYKFWYDCLKIKYGDNVNLLYTDTDSFILEIFTDDVYEDMKMTIIYLVLVNIQKIINVIMLKIRKNWVFLKMNYMIR